MDAMNLQLTQSRIVNPFSKYSLVRALDFDFDKENGTPQNHQNFEKLEITNEDRRSLFLFEFGKK